MRSILVALIAVAFFMAPVALWAQQDVTKEEAEEMIEAYQEKLAACNSRVADIEGTVSALQAEVRGLDSKISALNREISDLNKMIANTYTVKEGDWLAKLAEYPEIYGHGNYALWPKIYNANKDKIKDPNLIHPGQVLIIPRTSMGK